MRKFHLNLIRLKDNLQGSTDIFGNFSMNFPNLQEFKLVHLQAMSMNELNEMKFFFEIKSDEKTRLSEISVQNLFQIRTFFSLFINEWDHQRIFLSQWTVESYLSRKWRLFDFIRMANNIFWSMGNDFSNHRSTNSLFKNHQQRVVPHGNIFLI